MAGDFSDEGEGKKTKFTDVVGSYLDEHGQSFADLLDAYDAGMNENLRVGDKIRGEIISVGMDTVFINTGSKTDGAVDKLELLDESGEFSYGPGDVLELYIVSMDDNGIKLSKAMSGAGGLNLLRDAHTGSVPVEGKVTEECKGGFHVEVMKKKAFCPVSQMDTAFVEKPEDYVGQSFQFLITRIEEKGKNIVVSRRDLLERESKVAKKEFLETIEVGSDVDAKIKNIMPYGAFAEIFPGLEGMIHISEMSWSRVERPEDMVTAGETVRVRITGIEKANKPGALKISLSMKQVAGDPWETDDIGFGVGEKVRGKVTRCAGFGAFVELAPGIEGLIHISEMSYKKRVLKPEDVVREGETVDVLIKDIDREKRRISLSLRDAEGDPWSGVGEKYAVGRIIEGHVEKREKFGFFITLEPGVTGLLPKSKISESANPSAIEKLREGDAISVIISEIHPVDRKITLGPGDSEKSDDWRSYTKKNTKASSFGSLGEQLQKALDKKDK